MAAILLVDDDDFFRFLVSEFLENVGYKCSQAENVAQARNWLKNKKFELVISDFNMPRESGLDLLRYVRSQSPLTPFIMVTGEDSLEIRRKALNMGAYEYFVKPFKLHRLLMCVSRVLSQGRQQNPGELGRPTYTPTPYPHPGRSPLTLQARGRG